MEILRWRETLNLIEMGVNEIYKSDMRVGRARRRSFNKPVGPWEEQK